MDNRICAALAVALLLVSTQDAQAAQNVSINGRLTGAGGTPLPDGDYSVAFNLYGAADGATLMCAVSRTVSLRSGLFAALIGGPCASGTQTTVEATFAASGTVHVGVQVSGDPEMAPLLPVAAVAYALEAEHAKVADLALAVPEGAIDGASLSPGSVTLDKLAGEVTPWGGDGASTTTTTNVGIGTPTPRAALDVAGGIRVGNTNVCDSNTAGTLRWTGSALEFCDGSTFQPIASSLVFDSVSAQSCDELVWTTSPGGSAECGNVPNASSCTSNVTWEQARDQCQAAGARLCTRDELKAGAATGTGCSFDNALIWSSTSCGSGGAYLVSGNYPATPEEYCEANLLTTNAPGSSRGVGLRCCADQNQRPTFDATSSQSCSDINVSGGYGGAASVDCAAGDSGAIGGCTQNVGWIAARHKCESNGMRLCTRDEIVAGGSAGTGCSHDSRMVWTSTPCGLGGFQIVEGDYSIGGLEACQEDIFATTPVSGRSELGVRCCGDESIVRTARTTSTSTCGQLGWNPTTGGGSAECGNVSSGCLANRDLGASSGLLRGRRRALVFA